MGLKVTWDTNIMQDQPFNRKKVAADDKLVSGKIIVVIWHNLLFSKTKQIIQKLFFDWGTEGNCEHNAL